MSVQGQELFSPGIWLNRWHMQSMREQKRFYDIPITLGEGINEYINGALLLDIFAEKPLLHDSKK